MIMVIKIKIIHFINLVRHGKLNTYFLGDDDEVRNKTAEKCQYPSVCSGTR